MGDLTPFDQQPGGCVSPIMASRGQPQTARSLGGTHTHLPSAPRPCPRSVTQSLPLRDGQGEPAPLSAVTGTGGRPPGPSTRGQCCLLSSWQEPGSVAGQRVASVSRRRQRNLILPRGTETRGSRADPHWPRGQRSGFLRKCRPPWGTGRGHPPAAVTRPRDLKATRKGARLRAAGLKSHQPN